MKQPPLFQVPENLPPETALALFDLLSGLVDALWQHYEMELIELMMEDLDQYPAAQQVFDFDDVPSF